MLKADDRRARLEELLERIGKSRGKPAEKRTAQETKTFESVPPPSPLSEVRLEQPFAVADAPEIAAASPEPARRAPARREEVVRFEKTASASEDVAVIDGRRTRQWTLEAVLDRAWKLGAS